MSITYQEMVLEVDKIAQVFRLFGLNISNELLYLSTTNTYLIVSNFRRARLLVIQYR